MSPKRGAYPREFRDAAVRMLRTGREPNELARELGVTPGTLRVWLYVANGGTHGFDRSREAVIRVAVQAFDRLDRILRPLPDSALEMPMLFRAEPIDPWLVKDAVAHVVHYKARVVQSLRAPRGGEARRRKSKAERQMDEYWDPASWAKLQASDELLASMDARTRRRHGRNHLVYMRWRDRTPGDVLAWHRLVHKLAVSVLESASGSWFSPGSRHSSERAISHGEMGALSLHSDTHLRDIQRTLQERREDGDEI